MSPNRWTEDEIKAAYKRNTENPIDVAKSLPPKQSRRYIVVGGAGMTFSACLTLHGNTNAPTQDWLATGS